MYWLESVGSSGRPDHLLDEMRHVGNRDKVYEVNLDLDVVKWRVVLWMNGESCRLNTESQLRLLISVDIKVMSCGNKRGIRRDLPLKFVNEESPPPVSSPRRGLSSDGSGDLISGSISISCPAGPGINGGEGSINLDTSIRSLGSCATFIPSRS